MASLSNRVSNCFPINSSLKWWLFQCFFRPFTVSPTHNLKKTTKKDRQTRSNTRPPDLTRDPYFSSWVGFLTDKPNCYQVGLQVAVKPTRYQSYLGLIRGSERFIYGGTYKTSASAIQHNRCTTFLQTIDVVNSY